MAWSSDVVSVVERAIVFMCDGNRLLGILHEPSNATRRGILVVVGGPQYRVGSHRHFVILARALAGKGVPVMRFDRRGMGDSDGPSKDFDEIGLDIQCALEQFFRELPGLDGVVLLGLCDGAEDLSLVGRRRNAGAAEGDAADSH